jgi:CubicO group peptidase (beta-lactamase class C family)
MSASSQDIAQALRAAADRTGLYGVARIRIGDAEATEVRGMAHRGWAIPNGPDTRFGIASGTKGFTAVTVLRLVEAGALTLQTRARSLLGADLPDIDDRVTVEHLLSHRSGMGDYFDEDAPTSDVEYPMPVPVHQLDQSEDYLRVLGGHPTKFAPGERFSYSNGGYVLLAVLAERASGVPFHELVTREVCAPAGLTNTGFLRSDDLPSGAALGYIDAEGNRTNVLHLPVRGSGDGGLYTTIGDVERFWSALIDGTLLPPSLVADAFTARTDDASNGMANGLGFWLHRDRDAIELHGFDPGVGFVSVVDRHLKWSFTTIVNMSRGAWPMREQLLALLPA